MDNLFIELLSVSRVDVPAVVESQSISPKLCNKFYGILHEMRNNYPSYVSTFGECCTDGCGELARGSGLCGVCCEREMAGIVGGEIAADIHTATTETCRAIGKALDKINE